MTSSTGEAQYVFKDPDERLDFETNYGDWLKDDDTIVNSTWVIPTGIASDDSSFTDTAAVVWLTGGTAGVQYHLVNRITTAQGRVRDRSKYVTIREN